MRYNNHTKTIGGNMEKELLEGYTILLGGVKDVKAVVVKALLDSSDMENAFSPT